MREIKTIVIHHSGNADTPEKIRNLHINIKGWEDIGYHFMIDREGKLLRGRNLETVGAHVYGYNEDSIGVCLLGNLDKENAKEKQLEMLRRLIGMLCKEFDLNNKNIRLHRDFPNVTKSCPGKNISRELILD